MSSSNAVMSRDTIIKFSQCWVLLIASCLNQVTSMHNIKYKTYSSPLIPGFPIPLSAVFHFIYNDCPLMYH